MALRSDLAGSLALHAGLALAVTLWTPMLHNPELLDRTLPVDIVTIDEFTRLMEKRPQEEDAAKPEPVPAAPEVAPPPPPEAVQDAMPELQATPPKEEKPTADTPVETPRFKVAAPVPVARPVLKPKPILDIGQVQALLNKTPDAPAAPDTDADESSDAPDTRLTLSEVDAFRAQMRRCWSPPAGAREAEGLRVNVRLSLTPAGTISAGPAVVNRGRLNDPFFRAAAESVLRAIRRCQPFSMPVEKYRAWRNLELIFDPRTMLGS